MPHDLVARWGEGKFEEADETYWADEVVSIEPMGDAPVSISKDAEERVFLGGERAPALAWPTYSLRIGELTAQGSMTPTSRSSKCRWLRVAISARRERAMPAICVSRKSIVRPEA